MLLAQADAITGDSTGARIGRFVDGNFTLAVVIAVAAVVVFGLVEIWLTRRAFRQRREVRRLRRSYEQAVRDRLDEFGVKLGETRADIAQLAELCDHVVGQTQMLRNDLVPLIASAEQARKDREPVIDIDAAGLATVTSPLVGAHAADDLLEGELTVLSR